MTQMLNKDKIRRSIKTYKSKTKRKSNAPDNRFIGYAIPFNPKPIKIYNDSSCTSQKYAPSTISTKGLAISRIRQNIGKIQLSKDKENDRSMLTDEDFQQLAISNVNMECQELTPNTHQNSTSQTIEERHPLFANSDTLVKTNSNLKLEPIFKRRELIGSETPSREKIDAYNNCNDPVELYGITNSQKLNDGQYNYVASRYQRLKEEENQKSRVELPQLGRMDSEYNYKDNTS